VPGSHKRLIRADVTSDSDCSSKSDAPAKDCGLAEHLEERLDLFATQVAPIEQVHALEKKIAVIESRYNILNKKTNSLAGPANPLFELETRLREQIQTMLKSTKAAQIE
jgi:hypothetical protein